MSLLLPKWLSGVTAHSTEGKAQQSGAQPRESKSTAKEGSSQREVRRTFKMLREV